MLNMTYFLQEKPPIKLFSERIYQRKNDTDHIIIMRFSSNVNQFGKGDLSDLDNDDAIDRDQEKSADS